MAVCVRSVVGFPSQYTCVHVHTHTQRALCALLWVLGYPLMGRESAKLDLSFPDVLFLGNAPWLINMA